MTRGREPWFPALVRMGDGRPFHARRWLALRCRIENRLAARFKRWAKLLNADADVALRHAVTEYHKANANWPQPDHIYPEMRGEVHVSP